jgi:gas vesicle protein
MNERTQSRPDYGFVIGLVAGTLVGAGLAMWLTPRSASALREQVADSARRLGQRASQEYRQASSRLGEAVDELPRKADNVRDDVAEAVARGAHDVERYAAAASDRVAKARQHPQADRSASTAPSL